MWVEQLQFGLDSDVIEFVAIGRLVDRSNIQDGLGAFDGPSHPISFHAVFHQMTAGTFDHSGRNRIAGCQVFVVLQHRWPIGSALLPIRRMITAHDYQEPSTISKPATSTHRGPNYFRQHLKFNQNMGTQRFREF